MKKRAFWKIKYSFLAMVAMAGVLNLSLGHLAMSAGQHSMDDLISRGGQGVCISENNSPVSSMLPCCLDADHGMVEAINISQRDDVQMLVFCESYEKVNFSRLVELKNTFEINFSPPERQALAATIMRE